MTLLGLSAVFFGMAAAIGARNVPGGRRAVARRAVAESVGMCTLALACEGAYTRNALEGSSACLGDVPGGYCLHDACDVVACPAPVGRIYALNLVRAVR